MDNKELSKKYKITSQTLSTVARNISKKFGEKNKDGEYPILDNWFELLNDNPYVLMEFKSFGFKRADTIAQKIGFDMDSPIRILVSVEHCVMNATSGDTILKFENVISKILAVLGRKDASNIISILKEANEQKATYILLDKNLKKDNNNPFYITIKKWAYVEKGLWQMLKRSEKLRKNTQEEVDEILTEIKKELPFELNEKQDLAVRKIPTSNINVLTGLGGCLPSDTEVLTKEGWIEISKWNGQDVLELNIVGGKIKGYFNQPEKFHKYKVDQFYEIGGKLTVSKYHNNLIQEDDGYFYKETTEDLLSYDELDFQLPTSYIFEGQQHGDKQFIEVKGKTKDLIKEVDSGEYMYCFTTTSGQFLIRQKGQLFCTGNSGKSFTTNTILKVLDKLGETYDLLAPTGTASKVLAQMTGQSSQTIHRKYYSKGKITCKWLVIDEASMLSLSHFELILDMVLKNRDSKVLLIGDINQLTPISAGSPFRDIINLIEIGALDGQVVHLTKIMRSSDELAIAHICKMFTSYGQFNPDILNKTHKGVEFIPLNTRKLKEQILSILKKKHYELKDTYILSSMNVREMGTKVINEFVQETNPKDTLYSDRFKTYKRNDILMHTKNNGKLNIFNGERIRLIGAKVRGGIWTYRCRRLDDNSLIEYDMRTIASETMLSYSCSCHKSQGQTIENVIVVLPSSHSYMLNRNMIYTAFSRASKNLIVLYEYDALKYGASKSEINKRKTFLREIYLRKK